MRHDFIPAIFSDRDNSDIKGVNHAVTYYKKIIYQSFISKNWYDSFIFHPIAGSLNSNLTVNCFGRSIMEGTPSKSGNGSSVLGWILKSLINREKIRNNSTLASDSPRHTRRPAEKGRKLLCAPGTYFPSSSNQRRGLNSHGFSQWVSVWCMFHRLNMMCVPLGMCLSRCIVTSCVVLCGTPIGVIEARRNVSWMVEWRRGSCARSARVGYRSIPTAEIISLWMRSWYWGQWRR